MHYQQTFSKIFKANIEVDQTSFLESVLQEHPYFGLAQFYSLKNLDASSTQYPEVAAKTNLFFQDALFLNRQVLEPAIISSYHSNHYNETALKNGEDESIKPETAITSTIQPVEVESIHTVNEVVDINKEEKVHDDSVMLFEPLHASDYFASQGIKLSEDALANDKLGKQLKSFTAWLKTMKKVHADKLPNVTPISETAVQTQAEKSNIEEEIVTEAMAEAYILQNKNTKALEIYSKLSLINPAKSAYFAAKIDSLKK